MARKVFISVLGTGNYTACFYTNRQNKFKSESTRFIQTATLENLNAKEWKKDALALFLVTQESYKLNWKNDGQTNRASGETIKSEGLESCLSKLNLKCKVEHLLIADGNNTEEIWEIFETIYDKLEENDELYFDITHGFRYLPMLVLVLINYSKFLKGIKVKSISYGNFEARDIGTNEADIVDLTPLSDLQDWTTAANEFIEMGSVKKLTDKTISVVTPIVTETKGQDLAAKSLKTFSETLPEIINDIATCRGKEIIKGEKVAKAQKAIEGLKQTSIKPFNPIFEKIRIQLDQFGQKENIKNGFAASLWCIKNGLIQQAVTILQETTVSVLCDHVEGLNYEIEHDRDLVNSAFTIIIRNIEKDEWNVKGKNEEDKNARLKILEKIVATPLFINLSVQFSRLQTLRNDINHSGMNNNFVNSKKFKEIIPDIQCSIIEIFINL